MSGTLICILSVAIGYLLGSIPFGLVLTKLAGTQDIRQIGSGNIGATNVLRTGHKGLAAATLLCDMLKGTAAVVLVRWLWGDGPALIAAAAAFLGHLFPVWLKFRGGKGVATYIGLLLGIAWPTAVAFCAIWLAVAALTRYSSLSALVASLATPVILWFVGQYNVPGTIWDFIPTPPLFAALTVLLWIMHRANIARLFDGTEEKIGQKAAA